MEQLEFTFGKPAQLLEPAEIFALGSGEAIAHLRESSRVERKLATFNARKLGDYLVMWANTPPNGGVMVLGMADDGKVIGCKDIEQNHINDLEKAGMNYAPNARIQLKRLPVINHKDEEDFLILVLVRYRNDRVVRNTKREAFIRRGDSKTTLTDEEIRELEIDRGQLDLEQEPSSLVYPDQFDRDMAGRFVAAVKQLRGLDSTHKNVDILQLRHLGTKERNVFIPNNACALLFAKDPREKFPGCRIRFQRFEGETERTGERYNVVKDVWIEGTVPQILAEAESVIESQLRDFSRLGPDGKFYTAPEYPKEAWYEAIVNAVVHRSYGLRARHIQVKMFDDRLEVISPGGFPPLVTPQNIYEIQHSRNPYLMDAMFYLDYVKMANEGTRRMRDTMAHQDLPPPEFTQTGDTHATVVVVLRNNIKQRRVWLDTDASHVVGAALFSKLTQDQKRLINWVAENGSINVSQASRMVSAKTWHTAKKILFELVDMGILLYEHRDDIERDPKARFILSK